MKFKIKNIALGTRDYPGPGFEDILFGLTDYIETATEYNNDGAVGPWTKEKKVIVRVHDVTDDFLLKSHLRELRKEQADILLLSETAVSKDWPDLGPFREKYSDAIGLFGTGITVDSLKAYHEHYGSFPDYVSIPINPYRFKKDLMDFLRKNGIGIIGHQIFGGPLEARKMLETFGLQFLARFAAWYCDIVVMSSAANLREEVVLARTLSDLIDTDDPDETIYELKADSVKPSEGVQRKIHTYSVVSVNGQNHTFKNDYNGYISPTELMISGKANLEHIPSLDMEDIREADNIYYETAAIMAEIMRLPVPSWKEEVGPYYRYITTAALKGYYPSPRYRMKVTKTGDVFRYSIHDRVCFWKKSLEYVLYVSERVDGGYNVFFRNL